MTTGREHGGRVDALLGATLVRPDLPDGSRSAQGPADDPHRASVQSWVRAGRAELDVPLWRAVGAWLETSRPFERVTYADRQPG